MMLSINVKVSESDLMAILAYKIYIEYKELVKERTDCMDVVRMLLAHETRIEIEKEITFIALESGIHSLRQFDWNEYFGSDVEFIKMACKHRVHELYPELL